MTFLTSLFASLFGFLLGFIIGCCITFYYFRTRWLNIKGKLEKGKDVDQALFEQTMPSEMGDFIITNRAEQVMRDAKEDISIDLILKDDE